MWRQGFLALSRVICLLDITGEWHLFYILHQQEHLQLPNMPGTLAQLAMFLTLDPEVPGSNSDVASAAMFACNIRGLGLLLHDRVPAFDEYYSWFERPQ